MRLHRFLDSSEELQLEGAFVSLRLVREALEHHFRLIIKEERQHYLCCTMVRYGWLYASPLFWLQPTLHLHFRNAGSRSVLSWHFSRLPLYAVIISVLLFLCIRMLTSRVPEVFSLLSLALSCAIAFLSMILLHTRLISRRIRRVLAKLGQRTA